MYHLKTVCLIFTLLLGFSLQSETFANDDDDDGRIIGGEPANIKDIPYQLSLRVVAENVHLCGASIISSNWAVTAAHCLEFLTIERFVVVAGATLTTQKGSVHPPSKFIIHPLYNKSSNDADIALIKVRKPFPLGLPGIQCISLASKQPLKGILAQVSGWGMTEKKLCSNHLLKVQVPIISNADCNKMYPEHVTEFMICAGYREGGKDSCTADSGGPLVINNKLVGIVSWGISCAKPNKPGVYTRVDAFRNWIISEANISECRT